MAIVTDKHIVNKKVRGQVFVTVAFSDLFSYSNSSRKRLMPSVRIPITQESFYKIGSGKGDSRRLRKGFRKWVYRSCVSAKNIARHFIMFESLSSVVEIRHSARTTGLGYKKLCPACIID